MLLQSKDYILVALCYNQEACQNSTDLYVWSRTRSSQYQKELIGILNTYCVNENDDVLFYESETNICNSSKNTLEEGADYSHLDLIIGADINVANNTLVKFKHFNGTGSNETDIFLADMDSEQSVNSNEKEVNSSTINEIEVQLEFATSSETSIKLEKEIEKSLTNKNSSEKVENIETGNSTIASEITINSTVSQHDVNVTEQVIITNEATIEFKTSESDLLDSNVTKTTPLLPFDSTISTNPNVINVSNQTIQPPMMNDSTDVTKLNTTEQSPTLLIFETESTSPEVFNVKDDVSSRLDEDDDSSGDSEINFDDRKKLLKSSVASDSINLSKSTNSVQQLEKINDADHLESDEELATTKRIASKESEDEIDETTLEVAIKKINYFILLPHKICIIVPYL
jgi:hypothetical protein